MKKISAVVIGALAACAILVTVHTSAVAREQSSNSTIAIEDTNENETSDSVSIEDGKSYSIISAVTGKYMNVSSAKTTQVQKGTVINLYKKSKLKEDDTQLFTFIKTDENTYQIEPRNSSFTINVATGDEGSKLICWTKSSRYDKQWIVEEAENGYTFRLKDHPDMYLTQSRNSLVIQKKNDTMNQIFKIK